MDNDTGREIRDTIAESLRDALSDRDGETITDVIGNALNSVFRTTEDEECGTDSLADTVQQAALAMGTIADSLGEMLSDSRGDTLADVIKDAAYSSFRTRTRGEDESESLADTVKEAASAIRNIADSIAPDAQYNLTRAVTSNTAALNEISKSIDGMADAISAVAHAIMNRTL